MFVWSKLSAVKWMDAWEERFAGNPNLVIEFIKGGKSIRLRVFCESLPEAEAVVERFGGSIRALRKGQTRAAKNCGEPEGGAAVEMFSVLARSFGHRVLLRFSYSSYV